VSEIDPAELLADLRELTTQRVGQVEAELRKGLTEAADHRARVDAHMERAEPVVDAWHARQLWWRNLWDSIQADAVKTVVKLAVALALAGGLYALQDRLMSAPPADSVPGASQ